MLQRNPALGFVPLAELHCIMSLPYSLRRRHYNQQGATNRRERDTLFGDSCRSLSLINFVSSSCLLPMQAVPSRNTPKHTSDPAIITSLCFMRLWFLSVTQLNYVVVTWDQTKRLSYVVITRTQNRWHDYVIVT